MSSKALAFVALTIAAFTSDAFAFKVTKNTATINNPRIFGIEVSGTDLSFYGNSDKVESISFQDYVIYSKEYPSGSIMVSEVVIDMEGSSQQLRIYSARPPGSADAADRGNRTLAANAQNKGLDPSSASKLPIPSQLTAIESKLTNMHNSATAGLVTKTYPNTTHSKTVEMVVSSKEELMSFYGTIKKLLCSLPATVTDGSAPAGTTTAAGTSTTVTIGKIGGCLFTLE